MSFLTAHQRNALVELLNALIDQASARVIVPPHKAGPGFWFGGGNLLHDPDGTIWLSGRYRDGGDSRTGLEAGLRGVECAVFRSDDGGQSFRKTHAWSKADLSRKGRRVVSFEGTALHRLPDDSVELFISSEKDIPYPSELSRSQKPGAGVWTIDRMTGDSVAHLDPLTLKPALENHDQVAYLHVKDPVVFDSPVVRDRPGSGTAMIFCSHPFCWSSGNTGLALRSHDRGAFSVRSWEIVSRGATWDVASTRITGRLSIPPAGSFAESPPCAVYFYDGAECMREHRQNVRAHQRPRGCSCEELGGAFFAWDSEFPTMKRLSLLEPLFVSPWGTGCSRYADAAHLNNGILATWQQAQADGSQPLVARFLASEHVEDLLA